MSPPARRPVNERSDARCDLDDDAFEARIDDPALIETHAEALAMIAEIEANVASIDMTVEVYRGEVSISGEDRVSDDRHAWYRKALYARAHRMKEIARIHRRDKELRSIVPAPAAPSPGRVERQAKQQRLQAEAQDRRAGRQLKLAEQANLAAQITERTSQNKLFVAAAREVLPPEIFEQIKADAKQRRRELLGQEQDA